MDFITPHFSPASAEIFVLAMGCLALLVSVFSPLKQRGLFTYIVVQLALLGAALISYQQFGHAKVFTFSGSYVSDNLAVLLKESIYVVSFLAFLYSRGYIRAMKLPEPEYYILGLFSVLGMMVLASAGSLLTIFLGLELFSLPLYAMVALRRESPRCTEAAMKYFIVGSLATGMLLYGMSMLFGVTHTLDLSVLQQTIAQFPQQSSMILVFGLVFVVVGIVFKLGGVPFHMWVPDVYDGAPNPVVMFLGSAAKLAAIALAFRLLVDGMPGLFVSWQQILIVVAVLSMALGNLGAIVQTSLKRMLAYSSIAHVGYATLGLLSGTHDGFAASAFYMISYAIMTLGAFGIITMLSHEGFEADNIDDYKGLNHHHPWLAFLMLLIMFSMAGIPPMIGFMAKLGVLEALIGVNLVWLAVVAMLFAIIGSYYYIRVVKVMYFEDAPAQPLSVALTFDMRIAISVNGLVVLLMGIFPDLLFNLCRTAFAAI